MGDLEVIPTQCGFFIFIFSNEDDRLRVQTSRPWVVGGAVLAFEEWRQNFKPQREQMTKALVGCRDCHWSIEIENLFWRSPLRLEN